MRAFILSSGKPLTQADLDAIGVLYWNVPADTYETDGILDNICKEQRYDYREVVREQELIIDISLQNTN